MALPTYKTGTHMKPLQDGYLVDGPNTPVRLPPAQAGYEGPLLILLHSARGLTNADSSSENDSYATAYVSKGERRFGPVVRWPYSWNCPSPCWNITRDLGCHMVGCGADAGNQLHLEIWKVGGVNVRLMDLAIDTWYELPLSVKRPATSKYETESPPLVRFMIISQAPLVKHIFLVRHGESLWNKAQREHHYYAMLEQVDHALSRDGLQQCHMLEDKINAMLARGGTKSATEDAFANAEVVLSSPLTRAIQTALVGVSPILTRTRSLRLCRNAREKRNRGSRDTTGTAMGEVEITSRVRSAFAGAGEDADKIARYTSVALDDTEAADRWWNSSKESASAVRKRIDEFLVQLRFLREERIVVVGHSHFFRALIQQHLRPDAKLRGASKEQLLAKKLMNCGVLKLTLDFNYGRDRPITAAELMLDSELV